MRGYCCYIQTKTGTQLKARDRIYVRSEEILIQRRETAREYFEANDMPSMLELQIYRIKQTYCSFPDYDDNDEEPNPRYAYQPPPPPPPPQPRMPRQRAAAAIRPNVAQKQFAQIQRPIAQRFVPFQQQMHQNFNPYAHIYQQQYIPPLNQPMFQQVAQQPQVQHYFPTNFNVSLPIYARNSSVFNFLNFVVYWFF
uniref:Uncharacterized protein n=1 Tax=Panagrolaimus superbus TaxID=310955 RepID=A0A914YFR2_9BILA